MSKKVLITGGTGDIAKAIKTVFEEEDFDVYAPSRIELDVTVLDSIEAVMEAYRPDILINNAGYVVPQTIKNADFEKTKKHIDVNLLGPFWCTEAALRYNPHLEIINIGSAAAIETHATWSEYCAAKAAVVMATKCWAEDGLFAVCISPGRTKTKMRKSLFPNEDQNTLLEPYDFAKVVLKAAYREFDSGTHVIVRKQNVEKILRGES